MSCAQRARKTMLSPNRSVRALGRCCWWRRARIRLSACRSPRLSVRSFVRPFVRPFGCLSTLLSTAVEAESKSTELFPFLARVAVCLALSSLSSSLAIRSRLPISPPSLSSVLLGSKPPVSRPPGLRLTPRLRSCRLYIISTPLLGPYLTYSSIQHDALPLRTRAGPQHSLTHPHAQPLQTPLFQLANNINININTHNSLRFRLCLLSSSPPPKSYSGPPPPPRHRPSPAHL